jgi:hypothetical protein
MNKILILDLMLETKVNNPRIVHAAQTRKKARENMIGILSPLLSVKNMLSF